MSTDMDDAWNDGDLVWDDDDLLVMRPKIDRDAVLTAVRTFRQAVLGDSLPFEPTRKLTRKVTPGNTTRKLLTGTGWPSHG